MLTITRIDFEQIKTYKSYVAKERVTLENPNEAVWFGAYIDKELVGFNCAVIKNGAARLKSDYVFDEHRNKGVYDSMFKHRLDYCQENNVKKATAFCTPLSLGTFLRYGFVPKTKNKNGIVFVVKGL